MISLWLPIAALSVGALVLILAPLAKKHYKPIAKRSDYDINVYKDQLREIEQDQERGGLNEAQATAAKTEIQRRMLAITADGDTPKDTAAVTNKPNIAIIGTIALLVPLGAVVMYWSLGAPQTPDYPFAGRTNETSAASKQDKEMVARLTERLRQKPDNLQGWELLGRSYMTMGQFSDGAKAYGRALALDKKRLDIAVNYAEALVLSSDGAIPDGAIKIFSRALASNPRSVKSRYYLGLNKAQSGDMQGALQAWVDIKTIGPKGAAWMPMIDNQIKNAAADSGIDPASIKPGKEALELAKTTPATMPPTGKLSREEIKAIANMSPKERNAIIRSMVEKLAARMQQNPDDADGWRRLAQAYRVIGDEDKAKDAEKRAKAIKN